MAVIRDASNDWSAPVILATPEIWQAREGNVFITTEAAPEADDGLNLVSRDGIRLGAGLAVRYRKIGHGEAILVREAAE